MASMLNVCPKALSKFQPGIACFRLASPHTHARTFTSTATRADATAQPSAAKPLKSWRALKPLTYSRAVVRGFDPALLAASALRMNSHSKIDAHTLERQHTGYTAALRKMGLEVIELPAAPGHADCVFIEDTSVVVGNIAVITRPGHPSRRGETAGVRVGMERLGFKVAKLQAPACLDGGDVLFTGQEVFVGLTSRTNRAGVDALAAALAGVPVTPVFLGLDMHDTGRHARAPSSSTPSSEEGHVHGPGCGHSHGHAHGAEQNFLHLKSIVTVCGPNLLTVPDTGLGVSIADAIVQSSKVNQRRYRLEVVAVPDAAAANVVCANGKVLCPADKPESVAVYKDILGARNVLEVDMSEFAKADGALTCCSLLLQ